MIDYGNGLIFPNRWAFGPPDPPDEVACDDCGVSPVDPKVGLCERCLRLFMEEAA